MLRRLLEYSGVYRVYEMWLRHTISKKPMPTHVALILDGNRRWARSRGWPPWRGHQAGADRVEELLQGMLKLGIKTVTLYVLSTENLKRSSEEVNQILGLVKERAERLMKNPDIHKYRVRVRVIGKKQLLPEDVVRTLEKLEAATANYSGHFLNLAIAYGGRGEILDAVKEIVSKAVSGKLRPEEIDEGLFEKHLYTGELPNPEPDLVIRTSGEARLSNFLLWQSAYSEFVFQDVYFPDFRMIDLMRAVRTYQQRVRRFGL